MGQDRTNIKGMHYQVGAGAVELVDVELQLHHQVEGVDADFPPLSPAATADLVAAAKVSQAAFLAAIAAGPPDWRAVWDAEVTSPLVRGDAWAWFALQ